VETFQNMLKTFYPSLAQSLENSKIFIDLYLKNNTDWKSLLNGLSEFTADAFFYFPAKELAANAKGKR